MQHENSPKQTWLDEALSLPCNSIVTKQEAREYLQPLLKRCNAKSRKTFWQWLRLQLARSEETAEHLVWMQESRVTPEIIVPHQREGFRYTVNGDVALIEVVDGSDRAIWKIPAERLAWALSLYPVFLHKLSPLELQETAALRRLQAQLKKKGIGEVARKQIENEIARLRAAEQMAFAPVPRFMLVKHQGGSQSAVHRLFLEATKDENVEACDGDYTNFATFTFTVTTRVALVNGAEVYPREDTETVTLPNLYIVDSDTAQQKFEKALLQNTTTPQGDIDETPLAIQPNADLGSRAQHFGKIEDAGKFEPLTEKDAVPVDYVGRKVV